MALLTTTHDAEHARRKQNLSAVSAVRVIRTTQTVCPECDCVLEGRIIVDDGKAYLERTCPEHGPYRLILSRHGEDYADLDRFFFDVIHGVIAQGRITNYWILSTIHCQQKCKYCSADLEHPAHDEMPRDLLLKVIEKYGSAKLTMAGGEPTLHPDVLAFFREAAARGVTSQLATNGLLLASRAYCRELQEANVSEVRVSIEAIEPGNEAGLAVLGTGDFYETKHAAIRNLLDLKIPTILSPTIFKGINDDQLVATLEFAKDKPLIREISVNGFAWNGAGLALSRDAMIMPDELTDLLYKRYGEGDRKSWFTFQKLMLALLQLVRIRLCLYTQIIIFVREKSRLVPFTAFFNMKRVEKLLTWWERFKNAPRFVQVLAMMPVLAGALRVKSLRLIPMCFGLFLANLFQIRIYQYPTRLLPVVLNTNCATLSCDEMVRVRCMSGCIYVKDGALVRSTSTRFLLDRKSGCAGDGRPSAGEAQVHQLK